MSSLFVLAHLSDPHLGPLPAPRWRELLGKRATGFINWRRKRHLIHRGDVLARIVADLTAPAPDHIAVSGDLVNISLPGEYLPALAWLASLGPPHDVTLVPGNHDVYIRGAARFPQLHWSDYMRGANAAGTAFPFVRRRRPPALVPHAPLGRLTAGAPCRRGRLFLRAAGGAGGRERNVRRGADCAFRGD